MASSGAVAVTLAEWLKHQPHDKGQYRDKQWVKDWI